MIFLTQPDNIETSGSEVPDSINTKASPAQPDKIETSAAASLVEALAESEGSTISKKNKDRKNAREEYELSFFVNQ